MSTRKTSLNLCRRLRSKKMFVSVETDPNVPGADDGFCWCSHTMNCLGPDGKPVESEKCQPGRECFESL